MFPWPGKTILPIGIEIGPRAVRLLQLRHTSTSAGRLDLAIHAINSQPLPEIPATDSLARATAVTAALRSGLAAARFSGRTCVTALDPHQFQAKSIRLPTMPEAELLQAAQWEARDRLGLDPADGRLVCMRAGEIRRGLRAQGAGDGLRRASRYVRGVRPQ